MSTKCSIAYKQDSFHFYEECLDDEFVYLRQDGIEFGADQHGVMVAIPVAVMDEIAEKWLRHRGK